MLRLTVLGACGTWPAPGRACSGYLLEAASPTGRPVRVWVDAGPGTFAALQRLVPPAELDAVWLSHLHPDHYADLAMCYHYLRFGPHPQPVGRLAVYGPPGWPWHLNRFLAVPGARGPGGPDPVSAVFAPHELADGAEVRLAGLAVTAAATFHGVPTFGLRATDGEHLLAYSADAGPTRALLRLAWEADLLVCDAAWPRRPPGCPPVHCTPEQAGRLAARAGVKRLVLGHLRPDHDPRQATARAAQAFGGPVQVAVDGTTYQLGPPERQPPARPAGNPARPLR